MDSQELFKLVKEQAALQVAETSQVNRYSAIKQPACSYEEAREGLRDYHETSTCARREKHHPTPIKPA